MDDSLNSAALPLPLAAHPWQELALRREELLLTLGSYHSPLALVVEESGVAYTAHAASSAAVQRGSRGRGYWPAFECRRGFDTERGRAVPLRHALGELL